jgi:hypothetical protein
MGVESRMKQGYVFPDTRTDTRTRRGTYRQERGGHMDAFVCVALRWKLRPHDMRRKWSHCKGRARFPPPGAPKFPETIESRNFPCISLTLFGRQ